MSEFADYTAKGGRTLLNENQILHDFKKGSSKEQIMLAVKRSEEKDGRKITQKAARAMVEEVLLKDYLRSLRNQAI